MADTSHLIERAARRLAAGSPLGRIAVAADGGAESVVVQAPIPGRPTNRVVGLAEIERIGLIDPASQASTAAEELWHVQRQLLRIAFTSVASLSVAPPNLVLITSARAGEGKTFTATNLAASVVRQRDHSALLVDACPKNGSLTDLFGLSDAPGLLNCAHRADADATSYICETEIPGLAFLPRGAEPQATPDPLARRRVANVLQALARDVPDRLVIMDVAPCLMRGDAAALARVVGQILLVVEAERTQRKEIESALDVLDGCPGLSVVLNKSRHPAKMAQHTGTSPAHIR